MECLIGKRVYHKASHRIGTIQKIENGLVEVDFCGEMKKYSFPAAFSSVLEIEDERCQKELVGIGADADFEEFRRSYSNAIAKEIWHLKETGGRKYRIMDGERVYTKRNEFLYAFDTDTEFHFPDNTPIKLRFEDGIVNAYVVSCEEFTIMIRTQEFIGEKVESVEFTAEQWMLLEALMERLDEMDPDRNSIAYELACRGRENLDERLYVMKGQEWAIKKALNEKISFVWGPPGTGKTYTLSRVALDYINQGKRVLMLSYSNVSVDGALLRVADMIGDADGKIFRYGYPRMQEVLESKTLTSYQYILNMNREKAEEYRELQAEKKRLKQKDPRKVEINKKLNKIREELLEKEKELIQVAPFVATTISKAVVDKSIYTQNFDVVIFDEASMAYVPQIVFAGGLAKTAFICLGDFCQLPAIVQNEAAADTLARDIFEYVGILAAVENGYGHQWLTMLNTQYRMHPEIAAFVGKEMYGGFLETSEKIYKNRQEIAANGPMKTKAMGLVDLSGMYSVCVKTMDKSRINLLSALMCIKLANEFADQYDVGIISPYSAQARLILAMIRDMRTVDERFSKVVSATVHQFQGSEKSVIIYDAVDCFRMPYPGTLLTSLKRNEANRLFNVAITRAKGKFIVVTNRDFMERKKISKKLMFKKSLDRFCKDTAFLEGDAVIDELSDSRGNAALLCGDRESTWSAFLTDIRSAKKEIHIDIPGVLDEDEDALEAFSEALEELWEKGVKISIKVDENVMIPENLQEYSRKHPYVTNPVAVIDQKIVWYGQPLSAADFITEGDVLMTETFPCVRFEGIYTARLLKAFLEFSR